jgi:hypothetical protein
MADDVKDATTTNVDDSSTTEGKTSEPDENTKAALKVHEEVTKLLEDHEFDSLEDLKDAMNESGSLKAALGEMDVNELKAAKDELDKIHAYWASEEAKRANEEEEPEDKISRLEKEIQAIKSSKVDEETRKQQREENERILESFNDEVSSFIKKQEGFPEEYRPFTELFLGVNNPANEIDITDKSATRKMCRDGLKSVGDFEQAVIKRYLDGKIKVPAMTKTDEAPQEPERPTAKNIKHARSVMEETLGKLFGAK